MMCRNDKSGVDSKQKHNKGNEEADKATKEKHVKHVKIEKVWVVTIMKLKTILRLSGKQSEKNDNCFNYFMAGQTKITNG